MHKLTALAMTAALAIAPAMASASTTITYTGVIGDIHTSGDAAHFFGAGVTYGTAYALVYTIHDDAGATHSTPNAYAQRLQGVGAVSAAMTINGITQTIDGSYAAFVLAENGRPDIFSQPTDFHGEGAQDFSNDGFVYRDYSAESYISSYLSDFLASSDYHDPFSYTPVGADSYYNYFYINEANFKANTGNSIYLNLAPGKVTAVKTGAPGPVPEPASWALMIGGFGALGGTLRVRRRAVPVSRLA